MKRVAHLALTLSIASLTYAQTREPLFGRVVNADDKPLAGATVTLVEDDLDLVGIDPVDVLTVITDKRGRFAAQALRGVRYSAFALATGDDGRALVSKPVSNLFCGGDAKLHAIVTGYARRVPLPDLGAWGELQNLRVRLRWSGCAGHHVDLPIDDGGGRV